MSAESMKDFQEIHIPRVLKARGLPPNAIKIHTPPPQINGHATNGYEGNGHSIDQDTPTPDDIDDPQHWNALQEVHVPRKLQKMILKSAMAIFMMFQLDPAQASSQKSIEGKRSPSTAPVATELNIPEMWQRIIQVMNLVNPAAPAIPFRPIRLERVKENDPPPAPPPGAPMEAPPPIPPRNLPRAA